MVRPKSTHNPLGDIAIHERWPIVEEALFAKLCIERSLKKEVYLAAYLACWLYVFVLPGKDVNSIRPSTFKMASLMANGRRVNLPIPLLASIYEGLNTIATSPKPAELRSPKMTRFYGEGGAKYYEPREACKRIHKAEFISWACNMLVKYGPFKFVDDGHAEELDHNYFVAICSSYLLFIKAADSSLSHIVPIDLRVNLVHETFLDDNIVRLIRPKSIKITLKRKKNEDKQVDGGENNLPRALVPSVMVKCDSQAAVEEASKGKEDEVQSIDVGEESETSYSSTTTPPLGMKLKRKQTLPPAAMSVFEVRAYDEARSLFSEKLSRSLHEQQLEKAKACLQDVQAKASEEASEVQSAMDELEHIEKEIVALKGRRTCLRATLKGKKQLNHDASSKVHECPRKTLAAP
ncbi:hypothetical protein Sango_1246700 [Sesamum angolense]|uniref:Aminotransferase-like plant mobile domain-containing protein n=1 Tax=Sesamum angolense TaxID=2727404 RepID=A0AAE2BTZ5_9LAMI|nr:hypothetical protein Sango_1246700 [Sesamum angolense]